MKRMQISSSTTDVKQTLLMEGVTDNLILLNYALRNVLPTRKHYNVHYLRR